jgi:hypothetical protein
MAQTEQERHPAGLEEYTEEHWAILSPASLGFRGRQKLPPDAAVAAAEADMANFFAPHNARLDKLMAARGWPWSPFRASDSH